MCHLQAHVSNLQSHMSEHVSTWFGLVGARIYKYRRAGTETR
jgi:hypothetical protein